MARRIFLVGLTGRKLTAVNVAGGEGYGVSKSPLSRSREGAHSEP